MTAVEDLIRWADDNSQPVCLYRHPFRGPDADAHRWQAWIDTDGGDMAAAATAEEAAAALLARIVEAP